MTSASLSRVTPIVDGPGHPRYRVQVTKYSLAVLVLGLAACGGGGGDGPDGAVHGDDAGPSPDGGDPCSYHEADDNGNDTAGEATGITLATSFRICGDIAANPPGADDVVDTDIYAFAVGDAGPILVRVVTPDGEILARVRGLVLDDQLVALDGSEVRGVHAAIAVQVDAGTLHVAVEAYNPDAPEAAVPYEIRVAVDDPDTRCGALTGVAASYVEQHDGVTNIDNDMIEVSWSGGFYGSLTSSSSDLPETSGPSLTISAGMSYSASGSASANANALADDYIDRDTYVIASGAETNELSVRLTWVEDGLTDLDVLLFPANLEADVPAPLTGGTLIGPSSPEFATTSLLPSTSYWLWVGSFDGSAVPVGYELTLCGATFSP
jgi:hypothetical protein